MDGGRLDLSSSHSHGMRRLNRDPVSTMVAEAEAEADDNLLAKHRAHEKENHGRTEFAKDPLRAGADVHSVEQAAERQSTELSTPSRAYGVASGTVITSSGRAPDTNYEDDCALKS